ncbi:Maf family protein [Pokkaliibacter sp. CJK22405]|uniref:Maf family protein n=1 Tax=Pokkaliibacter sp. CJK22405 TaxID=3384615 RepID=UPI0039855BDE
MTLILASQSPRRKQLLSQLGAEFTIEVADIDETPLANESPAAYVERLAIEKARVIAERHPSGVCVLGSDTTVVADGKILGKPVDQNDAINTLLMLSDREHQVLTSVAVVAMSEAGDPHIWCETVTTQVTMMTITPEQALAYWQTGEPADKAGSYGLQGIGGAMVRSVKGSYSAVIGLPLSETAALLAEAGCPTWLNP